MTSPDPSGSGIGKAAQELLQEMEQAQNDMQKAGHAGGAGGPNEAFQAAMQQTEAAQQTNPVSQVNAAEQAKVADKASNVLLQARDNLLPDRTSVGGAEKAEEFKLGQMIQNLVKGQDRMSEIMDMALSGRSFSPPELIAMQAGVYRFTQELELTSKVVEKATSGIKQTMNTQV